jgi:hypothetical protein
VRHLQPTKGGEMKRVTIDGTYTVISPRIEAPHLDTEKIAQRTLVICGSIIYLIVIAAISISDNPAPHFAWIATMLGYAVILFCGVALIVLILSLFMTKGG